MPKKQRDPNDIPADEAVKPPKPKKSFEITVTIWDDGDITSKFVQFVKKDRGAPEKWLRKPDEFNAAIKANISDEPLLVIEKIAEGMNIRLSELINKKPDAP